ncbi:MAG TPA: hypothetical protein VEG38_08505 [Acidimicrobiia bacterium]|nr:hypothetical protein [Acidimicrobiia bacterium]
MPQLAPDVELLGPYRDSGLENPPYLVRRGGRILQVSRLLHAVAAVADGRRTFDQMAAVAATELDRSLSGDDVRFLVENKLAPAGILTVDGAASATPEDRQAAPPPPGAPAPDSRLLALRFRRAVASPDVMSEWARRFTPLFRRPVVAAIVAGVLAVDLWVFGIVGVGGALEDVVRTPALILFLLAAVALSGALHEIGHAAGCVASGGRAGAAGIGLYLCWPVLYTNVTDAYRLDRRGRLRTDLGGIYFNAVCIVLLGGAYVLTRWEPLLAVIAVEHLLVLHQLTPWLRLDGFYIVSDLTGVPDILSRVRPALRSLIPGRPTPPEVLALRPRARRILYGYLVSLVVFIVVAVVPAVLLLPRTLAASWDAIGRRVSALGEAAGRWDTVMVLAEAIQIALLSLSIAGLMLSLGYAVAQVWQRRAQGRGAKRPRVPVRRWLESSELAIVEGAELPDGGAVDYFGFGPGGEIVLFGAAVDRTPQEVAARLVDAASQLRHFSAEKLDRLLLDGPPFVEVVAGAARRSGRPWNESEFRVRLEETMARADFQLIVLEPNRFGTALRVYPLTRSDESSQN